jgi:hypothetical protein
LDIFDTYNTNGDDEKYFFINIYFPADVQSISLAFDAFDGKMF